jgi:cation-transporting ATPase E
VAEGRRVIANIERVARLFLTKTAWAAVLAVLTGVLLTRYPIRPRHLTVVDALTIGIPGFVLSFQPSHDPARPGFIKRVVRFSIPAGIVTGAATMAAFEIGHRALDRPIAEAQAGAAMTLVALGLWVLFELSRPLDRTEAVLLGAMVVLAIGAFTVPFAADFFLLEIPSADFAAWIAGIAVVAATLVDLALRVFGTTPSQTSSSSAAA